MAINLKAFMKEELKNRGTMQFEGIDKFLDDKGKKIPFIIRRLSMNEIKDIRERHVNKTVYRDRKNNGRPIIGANGQVAVMMDYDADAAGLEIMVEAFEQPKLDDPELMEFYGVLNRLDMPHTIFADRDDFQYADKCLMEACGLSSGKDEKDIVEEIKN